MFCNLNGKKLTALAPDAIVISYEDIRAANPSFRRESPLYRELWDRADRFRASKTAILAFTAKSTPPSSKDMFSIFSGHNDGWDQMLRYFQHATDKRMLPVLDRIFFQEDIYELLKQHLDYYRKSVEYFDNSRKQQAAKKKKREEIEKKISTNQAQVSATVSLLIPEIGTKMVLAEDWHMEIHNEYRNAGVLELTEIVKTERHWDELYGANAAKHNEIVFPKGSMLTVDRIYIRKGASDFSSLTFYIAKGSKILRAGKEYASSKALRFWAKLKDVNNMKVQFVEETVVK
jgi:hypothetical protein